MDQIPIAGRAPNSGLPISCCLRALASWPAVPRASNETILPRLFLVGMIIDVEFVGYSIRPVFDDPGADSSPGLHQIFIFGW